MRNLKREIQSKILKNLKKNKVLVLAGARRVGKTELVKSTISKLEEPYLLFNGEDMAVQELLQRRTVENYKHVLGDKKILIIDEAQKIPEIGLKLKLMIDEIEGLKILVTGSSAFDVSNKMGEPLTGRMKTIRLFPLSEKELRETETVTEHKDRLHQRLIFGNYPELIHLSNIEDKTEYLRELVDTYLLKDILALENIRNASKIKNLLRLIAFQIGGEVSYQELGTQLGMSKNSVEKYLELLEKVFVLYKVEGFSRNLRKEITKTSRWYFHDNGLRNIIVANMNALPLRQDVGQLWENYIISERLKRLSYSEILSNKYFWRTYDQQEIDWVEEREGKLFAFEIKWNPRKKVKVPAAWEKGYPDSTFVQITQANYLEWIL